MGPGLQNSIKILSLLINFGHLLNYFVWNYIYFSVDLVSLHCSLSWVHDLVIKNIVELVLVLTVRKYYHCLCSFAYKPRWYKWISAKIWA